MDNKCRQHIRENLDELVRLTDYNKLMHACVSSGLLTEIMRKNIENIPLARVKKLKDEDFQNECHRRLFEKITKRGPEAYQLLKTLLSDLQFGKAMQVLNGTSRFYSIRGKRFVEREPLIKINNSCELGGAKFTKFANSEKLPSLVEYTEEVKPKVVHHVQKTTRLHVADDKIGDYPMKSQHHRGVLFMVNIIDFPDKKVRRNASEDDAKSLLYLFKELNFKLFAYVNLTQKEFFHLLDAIIDSEYARDAECFVLVLMTHGDMKENWQFVQFHDGSVVNVLEIENRFDNRNSPNLVHKPKILIFPFCRGLKLDYGHYPSVQTDGFPMKSARRQETKIASLSDIIICYASLRGFRAHRDPFYGSWYIQKFCELMAKHAQDTSFEDIIKIVQSETGKLRTQEGSMQMGNYQNIGFNAKLFFNPGAWEDSH